MDAAEDRIETPAGTVCACYLSPRAVLAVSGKDVGWLRVDGEPRYASQRFVRDDAGTWVADEVHRAYANVAADGSRVSGEPCPPHVEEQACALLRETVLDWMRSRPERAAEADLAHASEALRKNAVGIASLRDALAREGRMKAVLESRVADARERLEALTDAVPPAP